MAEKEVKVSESDIKRVVRGYILRMFKIFETLHSVSTDEQIDCPACNKYRSMCCGPIGWECCWFGCRYKFPEGMAPPSPSALKKYYQGKQMEERIAFFLK